MPSGPEWIILLVIVLVIFGGTQVPKLARNLGKAQKEFKESLAESQASTTEAAPPAPPKTEPTPPRSEAPTD
jgi:sec-independent protein translocase protein TatA